MGHGVEGLGAGNFVLAAVVDFYETLSDRHEEFVEYPDFYTFQATSDPADYRMLDIYPNHKNVGTDGDAEAVLRAVTDRAIDILLVPNRSPASPAFDEVLRRSAERRIQSCFCYSATGQLDDHGFVIKVPRDPVEAWYETTVDSTLDSTTRAGWGSGPPEGDHISQEFRRLPLQRALTSLASIGQG